MEFGSVINNILVHNSVGQIINIRFIMIMESKYNVLKFSTQKSIITYLIFLNSLDNKNSVPPVFKIDSQDYV